jgi:hypothetical protein
MMGVYPWRRQKRKRAVNKPGTDWFNAVTTALASFSVRFGDDETIYMDRPNPDGSDWAIVFPRSWAHEGSGIRGKYHFKIERASTTSIRVLGGSHIRDSVGAMNRVVLSGDGGPAPNVANFKTVSIGASVYVWVQLNDPLSPTTLTVQTNAAYPDPDNTSVKLVLGYVSFVDGEIVDIEQYWTGGDWRNQFEIYDDDSIDYNTAGKTQVRNFALAGNSTINNYTQDLLLFKEFATQKMAYTNIASLSEAVLNYWSAEPGEAMTWFLLGDTEGNPSSASNEDFIPIVTDQGGGSFKLELVNGGPGGSGPWWKLSNNVPGDAYGAVIGNSGASTVIDLDQRRLTDPGGVTWTLNWALRQFDGADWTALLGTVLKSSDTTPAGLNDGSIENQGGYYGKRGIYVEKNNSAQAGYFSSTDKTTVVCDVNDAVSSWDAVSSAKLCTGAEAGQFVTAANSVNICESTYAINVTGGSVNVNGSSSYYHDDVQGDTITDAGNNLFSAGIFTNEDTWSIYTIQAVIPGTGVRNLKILAVLA